jgi:hypothetical protein
MSAQSRRTLELPRFTAHLPVARPVLYNWFDVVGIIFSKAFLQPALHG